MKRWLLGTHHGGWGAQHVEAYLDEFVFRFNRRQSNARGLLFYRLLQNAVALRKINQEVIVLRPKPGGTKQRGRKRTRPYSTSAITNSPAPRKAATEQGEALKRLAVRERVATTVLAADWRTSSVCSACGRTRRLQLQRRHR